MLHALISIYASLYPGVNWELLGVYGNLGAHRIVRVGLKDIVRQHSSNDFLIA